MHRINTFIGILDDRITNSNNIGIVTPAAGKNVGGTVTGQSVIERVAATIDGFRTRQNQFFDIGRRRISDRGLDGVAAFCGIFNHHIGAAVHHVSIVAATTQHRVGSESAVEQIDYGIAS
ncbi:hypothetical protein D3C84_820930 [compost metagenome]